MPRILTCTFFLLFTLGIMAQDMTEGFVYLENGNFEKAQNYFKKMVAIYPTNKTAKLCYGRALGLSGDPEKAISIFKELKTIYPKDFEIKINYAESLLWNKNYKKAKEYYQNLNHDYPDNFAVILGYANTLSNLKEYPEALLWVDKALQLQSTNQNALLSLKYIRLGYAFQLSQNKEYEEALHLLEQNIKDFPSDKDTLLNLAELFLKLKRFDKAQNTYKAIATNKKDSIIALNGLALVMHKKNQNKNALQLSNQAVQKVKEIPNDTTLYLTTQERYIQALLWNRKFRAANKQTTLLENTYPTNPKILSLIATYGMYTGDFKQSRTTYQELLETYPSSFDGNLGIANAYRASGLDIKALSAAYKTLFYYSKQPDAEQLVKKIKKAHTPFLTQKTAYTFDNGDNRAINSEFSALIPISPKLKLSGQYVYRSTENSVSEREATAQEASLGARYKLTGNTLLKSTIGINYSEGFTTDYSQVLGTLEVATKPFKLQNASLGYQRQLQQFNADLIDREIVMNNYYLTYNLGTTFNLGWYTQLMHTSQSDKNTRNLLFTSLYYTLLHRPVLKTGINYQNISFKDQVPTIYFSPSKFNLGEIFIEVLNSMEKPVFYHLSAAVGRQWVENDPSSNTFRAEAKLGHHFSDRFIANLYAKYSNIASATAAGFEFTEFGFYLKWYFLKKPLFHKKIDSLQNSNEINK
ncbi:tetratricopeptide repeat protein [Aquimarina sp. ERC-38]|uniref:tetratricopeptide repeat protein n=1 Tax=Aquimarina sp. ERC-38 TaxID=2949996 RepID=UPI002247B88D|nr:tetratricopeptide repeat protein [Aquimarina sp. ERC-38]UZO82257.1 tetratricopeptide repeat protein [Aquimarina sp. ERC-38]